jgi:hypothetical protein
MTWLTQSLNCIASKIPMMASHSGSPSRIPLYHVLTYLTIAFSFLSEAVHAVKEPVTIIQSVPASLGDAKTRKVLKSAGPYLLCVDDSGQEDFLGICDIQDWPDLVDQALPTSLKPTKLSVGLIGFEAIDADALYLDRTATIFRTKVPTTRGERYLATINPFLLGPVDVQPSERDITEDVTQVRMLPDAEMALQ